MSNEGKEYPKSKKVRTALVILLIIISCIFVWLTINNDSEAGIEPNVIEKLKLELQQKDDEIKAWKQKDVIQTERIDALERSIKDVNTTIEQHIIKVNRKVFPQLATIITDAVMAAEKKYPNIPYSIILAVTELESTFRYTAVSNKNCIGLMQINYKVWLDETNEFNLIKAGILTNKDDLYDPTINIIAGTYILDHYYNQVESDDIKFKWEGALNKYFGDSSTDYFEKFQKFFGNFHLVMASAKK